jgi:hypothetical protein
MSTRGVAELDAGKSDEEGEYCFIAGVVTFSGT